MMVTIEMIILNKVPRGRQPLNMHTFRLKVQDKLHILTMIIMIIIEKKNAIKIPFGTNLTQVFVTRCKSSL